MRFLTCTLAVLLLTAGLPLPVQAQLTDDDIAALHEQGAREGWTFEVGPSAAAYRPEKELCGFIPPANWTSQGQKIARGKDALPASFDWRALNGCTAVKDQGGCGSCWAFATVGTLENNIKIVDGVEVDLSEQWLLSCNRDGAGCDGGWWGHDYHLWKADSCDGVGAVLEADFPYVASKVPCNCPYPHAYFIDAWSFVDDSTMIPEPELIKQAIYDYGPVAVSITTNAAFHAYRSGVFNKNTDEPTNHAVCLVGWDDSLGANGCWILRNSWGDDWGMGGYMYIEYGCSRVGSFASYVVYGGRDDLQINPRNRFDAQGAVGGPFTPASQVYTLDNIGTAALTWTAQADAAWITLAANDGKAALGPLTLEPGASVEVTATINAQAATLKRGVHEGVVTFTNTTSGRVSTRTVHLETGDLDYSTEDFDANDNDLNNSSLTFTPDTDGNFYYGCLEGVAALPTDPANGAPLALTDDSFVEITLSNGMMIPFFGVNYGKVYVGSNGYITFGAGDISRAESKAAHFAKPRVAALFDDLNPEAGGYILWQQLPNRCVATWLNVPEYGSGKPVTLQAELYFDGTVRITLLNSCVRDGLVGLSAGKGVPKSYRESNLSAYPLCGDQPGGGAPDDCAGQPVAAPVIDAGIVEALAAVYDLMDSNPMTTDRDNNCIMDGAHIALVDAVLSNPDAPCHAAAVKAWNYNYPKFKEFLDIVDPSYWDMVARDDVERLGAGVLTMGDPNTFNVVIGLLSLMIGITIDLTEYDTSCGVYMSTQGDADGDGLSNRAEYNYWFKRSLQAFTTAALDGYVDFSGGTKCGGEGEGEGEGEVHLECPIDVTFEDQGGRLLELINKAADPQIAAALPASWSEFDFENGGAWLDWVDGGQTGVEPVTGDGIPEAWQLRLLAEALCWEYYPDKAWQDDLTGLRGIFMNNWRAWNDAINALIPAQSDPIKAATLKKLRDETGALMAGLLTISQDSQDAYLALVAFLGISGDFQPYTRGKTLNEPFHALGDLDGDGQDNLTEYEYVTQSGGDQDDYIQQSMYNNPFWAGNPGLPAASDKVVAFAAILLALLTLRGLRKREKARI